MTFGEILTQEYPKILYSAKLITRKRNVHQAPDLINTTFIALSHKNPPSNNHEFVKWFVASMKLLYIKPQSKFNALAYSKAMELKIELCDHDEVDQSIEDYEAPEHLTPYQAGKYISLLKFKKRLPLHEQYLFDLYFLGGMSCNEISRELNDDGYDIPSFRVSNMVKSIKDKLDKWK